MDSSQKLDVLLLQCSSKMGMLRRWLFIRKP